MRAWTAAGRLRVWWVRWTEDGWAWTDPAASNVNDRGRETMMESERRWRIHYLDPDSRRLPDRSRMGCVSGPEVRSAESVEVVPAELSDAALVENELLRETFSETQLAGEDRTNGFFVLRVPRRQWLRLRAWRAPDPAHGRAGSRWWRHDYLELRALETALLTWADEATDRERTSRMGDLAATLLNELRRELAARVDEAVGS